MSTHRTDLSTLTAKSELPDEAVSSRKTQGGYQSDVSTQQSAVVNRFSRLRKPSIKHEYKVIKHEYKVIKIDTMPQLTKHKSLNKFSEISDYKPAFSDYNPLASKLTSDNVKALTDKSVSAKGKKSSKKFLN